MRMKNRDAHKAGHVSVAINALAERAVSKGRSFKNYRPSETPRTKYSAARVSKSLLSNNQNFASFPCRARARYLYLAKDSRAWLSQVLYDPKEPN